jgi:hypothetical protein
MNNQPFLSLLLFLILTAVISGCSTPQEERLSEFQETDWVRCVTGGGEGLEDEFLLTGSGLLRYKPVKGTSAEKMLTAEETKALFHRLQSAGLSKLKAEPNRELERYGVLLEANLEGKQVRATIGVLEMTRDKHHSWHKVMKIITDEIESCRAEAL